VADQEEVPKPSNVAGIGVSDEACAALVWVCTPSPLPRIIPPCCSLAPYVSSQVLLVVVCDAQDDACNGKLGAPLRFMAVRHYYHMGVNTEYEVRG
jgi:hypothetical protein